MPSPADRLTSIHESVGPVGTSHGEDCSADRDQLADATPRRTTAPLGPEIPSWTLPHPDYLQYHLGIRILEKVVRSLVAWKPGLTRYRDVVAPN